MTKMSVGDRMSGHEQRGEKGWISYLYRLWRYHDLRIVGDEEGDEDDPGDEFKSSGET
jgi:hypothetical protein